MVVQYQLDFGQLELPKIFSKIIISIAFIFCIIFRKPPLLHLCFFVVFLIFFAQLEEHAMSA